ncbi:hypothetical protein M427DRAFT_60689 [Gonapodya prolifera JEL478]|uniref:Splicing factor Cactin n=1 Tax=Gonapodya prolifera (strain JEL478) TaxID=1344416 RepID=A0A139A3U7_GONPJ|nr:hypothetical protein M427DRAFT_60689 [Gonapodya prolifera JEL478]|eukprot:KXS11461.1 hypothetical protein M427DRAFT_60689 [Gonapodya prolifera JEL478]
MPEYERDRRRSRSPRNQERDWRDKDRYGRDCDRDETRYEQKRSRDARDERDDRRDSKRSRRTDDDRSDESDDGGDRSRSRSPDRRKKSKRETSSERRERKKAAKLEKTILKEDLKKQKEAQLVAQMAATLGYSNTENPFGDQNLTQKFVWAKKVEKDQKSGLTTEERLRKERKRHAEVQEELERLKHRRREREEEARIREEEEERLRREREWAAAGDWEEQEDQFYLSQNKKRAVIRIKEGHAKPIDVLAMNISLASDGEVASEFEQAGFDIDPEEPYKILHNQDLRLSDVEELNRDVEMYLSLEKDEANQDFWRCMLIVCQDEISKRRRAADPKYAARQAGVGGGGAPTISPQIEAEIEALLADKSYSELSDLQRQVDDKLASGGPVDVEYWEALLKAIVVWKAKAKLREMHRRLLQSRLERLRERQREQARQGEEDIRKTLAGGGIKLQLGSQKKAEPKPKKEESEDEESEDEEGQFTGITSTLENPDESDEEVVEELDAYDGTMSPVPLAALPREDRDAEVLDPLEDAARAQDARRKVLQQRIVAKPVAAKPVAQRESREAGPSARAELDEEKLYRQEANKEMEEEEEAFNDEVEADQKGKVYLWQDKYRPRKPRYFNRVHTGYEWNKYNQTHYDTDNPPPKVVQGYKFNIFYPDLIDKSKAPTYKLVKDPSNPDTVIIRFIAGPPYEDIAFRIVNREWEYSHKKGYRCVYDRGILQLHFRYKRHFYRK